MIHSIVPRKTVVSAASAAEVKRSDRTWTPSLKIGTRLTITAPRTTIMRVQPNLFTARGRTMRMKTTARTTSSTEATEDLLPETAMPTTNAAPEEIKSQFL